MSFLEKIASALIVRNPKLADCQDIESKIAVSLLMTGLIATGNNRLGNNGLANNGLVNNRLANNRLECETARLVKLLARRFRVKQSVIWQLLYLAEFNHRKSLPVETLAAVIKTQYSNRKLQCLIRDLWNIAIVDDELHTLKETMIYHVADKLGLKRRDVIDQQSRVCK